MALKKNNFISVSLQMSAIASNEKLCELLRSYTSTAYQLELILDELEPLILHYCNSRDLFKKNKKLLIEIMYGGLTGVEKEIWEESKEILRTPTKSLNEAQISLRNKREVIQRKVRRLFVKLGNAIYGPPVLPVKPTKESICPCCKKVVANKSATNDAEEDVEDDDDEEEDEVEENGATVIEINDDKKVEEKYDSDVEIVYVKTEEIVIDDTTYLVELSEGKDKILYTLESASLESGLWTPVGTLVVIDGKDTVGPVKSIARTLLYDETDITKDFAGMSVKKTPSKHRKKVYADRHKLIKEATTPLQDLFETQPADIMFLAPFMVNIPKTSIIYDPCCGNKAFGDVFREQGFDNIVEHDLFTMEGENKQNYFTSKFNAYDILITNPPFAKKGEFLRKAVESGKPLILLLPLETIGYKTVRDLFKKGRWIILILPHDPKFMRNGKLSEPAICAYFMYGFDTAEGNDVKIVYAD